MFLCSRPVLCLPIPGKEAGVLTANRWILGLPRASSGLGCTVSPSSWVRHPAPGLSDQQALDVTVAVTWGPPRAVPVHAGISSRLLPHAWTASVLPQHLRQAAAAGMSALLSAMASSRSSCSCRSRAQPPGSAFALPLGPCQLLLLIAKLQRKNDGGLHGPEMVPACQPAGWGREDVEVCHGGIEGAGKRQAGMYCREVPGV